MLEFFALMSTLESKNKSKESFTSSLSMGESSMGETGFDENMMKWSFVILSLLIAFATAYLAFSCNEDATPATRALYTLIGFFFCGFYLIYYFIVHVLFGYPCGSGRRINNLVRNGMKKK